MDDEIKGWLLLMRLPVTTCTQLLRLIDIIASPSALLRAEERELKLAGLKDETIHHLRHPDWQSIEKDVEWLNNPEHHFIPFTDDHYPALLKEIPDPPPGLFVRGKLEPLNTTQLGIVGSRNPSPAGKLNAKSFAGQMARLGITVTSGLASGIDYCSHQGSLDENGVTIAVLGNGLDKVYPRHHVELAEHIADKGALVSEFATGTSPLARNFPRRNRIISGLSVGILVVEATQKSGSLITARHALEQGREVFAIPGSIHNPLTKGCHWLIKQGAKLVESHEDILEELNVIVHTKAGLPGKSEQDKPGQLDNSHKQLLYHISYDPISIDALVAYTGLTVAVVSSMLLTLEIQGMVATTNTGSIIRMS